MKKQERVVPKKNYLYLLIMILVVVFVTFFIFEINKDYQSRKLEVSYLNGYINEVNVSDINNILIEPSSDLFILVTKVNDESVYELERDIKKVIKDKDLRDNFIYINYSDKDINSLNKILGSDIKTIPALVYFKNGEYVKTIDSNKDMLNAGDLSQVLDQYEVE